VVVVVLLTVGEEEGTGRAPAKGASQEA
jgi:hypothetical protein